ncbi:aminopeptidase, partial [candidate division WOR-3 bacterium]|nr:aminopeptidase [candidate division WOR-3 bacterium]
MPDPRVVKMAGVIAGYSLALRPGDLVLVQSEPPGFPLVREFYRAALAAGANPYFRAEWPELVAIRLNEGSDEQLGFVSGISRLEVEQVNARLVIRAPQNLAATAGCRPDRQALAARAARPLFERLMERRAAGELRTCLTQFPTDASAQQAGMSLEGYEEFVFRACLLHEDDPVAAWQRVSRDQQRHVDLLDRVSGLRFEAPGTDIRMSVKGRKWINSDGKANFPSGEVFSAPVEDSVEGRVRFDVPCPYKGRAVEGVELEFRAGKVVAAKAERGDEFLQAQLDTDEGSRTLGEVAFGLNYSIDRPTGNILFDEKLGGTIHLALGAGYPDSGSRNKSAIHWDLIRTMTPGRVSADGKTIYEDG